MTVDIATPAWDVNSFQLVFNENANLVVEQKKLHQGAVMESDAVKLTMDSQEESGFTFILEDKKSGEEKKLSLRLQYWASWVTPDNWNNGQNSGVYNFRPESGEYDPFDYTELQGAFKSDDKQWDFYFQQPQRIELNNQRKVIVHVYLTDLGTVQYEVDYNSIPMTEIDGYEVIAKFQVSDFFNNQTFYTDSNGMEMQERKLNYRPTWDFVNTNLADSNENITGNYFPVQSALSMLDTKSDMIFTVMNDRSQGASALSEGTIEFMQNRRTPGNDNKGMPESLSEVDSLGNGIRVRATYNIQLFDNSKTKNMQRQV